MNASSLKRLLCAALIGSATLWSTPADASVVTKYVPMLTYADHTVPTYDKPNGSQKGFISPNVALVMITQIHPDGWAYGSYPIAGGKRIYRWFEMRELQGYANYKNFVMRTDATQTVFRTSSQNAKLGKVLYDADVLVVGETGDNFKIIYRVNGGSEYKMGWIEKPYDDYYDDGGNGGGGNGGNGGSGGSGGGGNASGGSNQSKGNVYQITGPVTINGNFSSDIIDSSKNDNSTNVDNHVDNSNKEDNSSRVSNVNETNNVTFEDSQRANDSSGK